MAWTLENNIDLYLLVRCLGKNIPQILVNNADFTMVQNPYKKSPTTTNIYMIHGKNLRYSPNAGFNGDLPW